MDPPTAINVPLVEDTYHAGVILRLYPSDPPAYRTAEEVQSCRDGAFQPRNTKEAYTQALKERVQPLATPPCSIILDQPLSATNDDISHVWIAQTQTTPETPLPSRIVAKIFDPVYRRLSYPNQPFLERDVALSREFKAYTMLKDLQGSGIPRFYGHFVAPLSAQGGRTVNVILLEYIVGKDLAQIVPRSRAPNICASHKDAIIEAVIDVILDIYVNGVVHDDLQPRNVILRSPKHHTPGAKYCPHSECPFQQEVDRNDISVVILDYDMAVFEFKMDTRPLDNKSEVAADSKRHFATWFEKGF